MNMKKFKNTKGQMRVIETILASFFIVAALSFFTIFAVSPPSLGYEMTDLEKTGYSALHDLDQQGLLAQLVYNSKWNDLRTVLKMTMANDVYFNLTIKELSGSICNSDSPILYGDLSVFSQAKNIASVTYCLAGMTNYSPKILVLELTKG